MAKSPQGRLDSLPGATMPPSKTHTTLASGGTPIPGIVGLDRHFLEHGYALVKVDARGSGASFGTRSAEYGREEVLDAYDVVEWVVSQEWSDGTVGAYGTSYTGTTGC